MTIARVVRRGKDAGVEREKKLFPGVSHLLLMHEGKKKRGNGKTVVACGTNEHHKTLRGGSRARDGLRPVTQEKENSLKGKKRRRAEIVIRRKTKHLKKLFRIQLADTRGMSVLISEMGIVFCASCLKKNQGKKEKIVNRKRSSTRHARTAPQSRIGAMLLPREFTRRRKRREGPYNGKAKSRKRREISVKRFVEVGLVRGEILKTESVLQERSDS